MTLIIFTQKVLLKHSSGEFQVDKLELYRVPRWRILQAFFTGTLKGEWPPKGKQV